MCADKLFNVYYEAIIQRKLRKNFVIIIKKKNYNDISFFFFFQFIVQSRRNLILKFSDAFN